VLEQKALDLYNEVGSPKIRPNYVEIDVNDPEQLRQVAAEMKAKQYGVTRDTELHTL
jgi:hypothetical protein